MNCSAQASVLISCPLFSLQSFSSGAGWGRNTERIGRDRANKKWSIEYCGMSCSELGQNQSKLKCSLARSLARSLSLSSLSLSLFFYLSLYSSPLCGETETPSGQNDTLKSVYHALWSHPSVLYCHLSAEDHAASCTGANSAHLIQLKRN